MSKLTEHFSLEELTFSEVALRRGFDNTPPPEVVANLKRLSETLLEPVRDLLGCPIHINSGYRADELNAAIGGAAHSAHTEGRAADLVPGVIPLANAFNAIRTSGLPFDQIIFECNAWIHMAIAPTGQAPRKQVLTASGHPGAWSYQIVGIAA